MRRTLVSILAIVVLQLSMTAQSTVGVKFSYGNNTTANTGLRLDNPSDIIFYQLEYIGQDDVLSLGVSHRLLFGPCFFQQDIMYRKQSTLFQMRNFEDRLLGMTTYKNEFEMIHIPISAGYVVHNIMIGGGPIINYIKESSKSDAFAQLFRMKEDNIQFGFQFLVGYQLGRHIQIELKYEKLFNGVTDGYYYNDRKVNIRATPNLVSLSAGLYF
jgi:hypothetical protein